MKKTLTLMALLCTLATNALKAENTVIWSTGIDPEDTSTYYTCYKQNSSGPPDHLMCWAASAASVIAWWEDQVTINGAYILPEDCPRGYAVWDEVRSMWANTSGQAVKVMQHWLSGDHCTQSESKFTQKGWEFTGYCKHLLGADYAFDGSTRSPYCMTTTIYASAKYAAASYDAAMPQIVQLMKEGWGMVLATENHDMTMYGMELNENNEMVKVWYNDNNFSYHGLGYMTTSTVRKGGENQFHFNAIMADQLGYGSSIQNVYAMRTTGMRFDTYEAVAGEGNTADLFSHFLNLTVDGASEYKLQYDLRNAMTDGSPVDARNEKDEKISTGDITLQDGKLSLVKGVADYDGGGKTTGSITFKAEAGASRTLSVQHTATIAAEIKMDAAENNTLEVTQGNSATFGKLSGTGNLDKTGAGAAEVTDAVTLNGEIRVKEGDFIFGKNVELTDKTVLTVSEGAHVQGKAGKSLTLSITSGVHENNGVMSLVTTMTGGVLKGSGTFADVTMDGGALIVGNSPGRQTYTEALTVNMGDIIFSVDGWNTAANGEKFGWGSGTYSNIVMGEGGALTLNEGAIVNFAVGGDALANLLGGEGGFSMDIATSIGNTDVFTSAFLQHLALQTKFYVATEDGADTANNAGLNAGADLTARIYNLAYSFKDGGVLRLSGSFEQQVVPEPATGTLSLLALAGLAARRRRK